jgi:histidinol-phosphatase
VSYHLDHELRLAHDLADAADVITLSYFKSENLGTETKSDLSPVTRADREVEHMIRQRLVSARPGYAVLGEEYGEQADAAARARWIIDPIDGTKRFMRGIPVFATLLALELDGEPVVGVVSAAALGRRWWAARGSGSFANGKPIRVSSHVQRLADAHLAHASLDGWLVQGSLETPAVLARHTWSTTGYGDFWSHVLVAEGAIDVAVEPDAKIWDLAPLKVIVEEAGGRFTDFAGTPSAAGPTAISSNGAPLHDELLALLGARL